MIGIVGDFHIPERASGIPGWILEKLKKVDLILCTGDLTEYSVLKALENIAETYCVRGNMDRVDLDDAKVLTVERHRILLLHGHQVHPRGNLEQLYKLGSSAGADMVIFGHTHSPLFTFYKSIYFLNPGSATGAWGGSGSSFPQSMALLDFDPIRAEIISMPPR